MNEPVLFTLAGAEPLTVEGSIQTYDCFVYDQQRRLNVLESAGERKPLIRAITESSDRSSILGLDVTTYMTEARGEGDRPD